MTILVLVLVPLIAYFIGGLPFGYLVARARGVDILHQGSGNIGATNVGRVLGRRFGVLVFFLDFAKGAVPVFLARRAVAWIEPSETWLTADLLGVAAGLAAFLGHLFPIYLHFRGGKGVATGAGVVAVLLPMPFLVGLLTWVAVLCATHYVSLASLAAAGALCLARLGLAAEPLAPENSLVTAFCFVAATLVVLRHWANLGRLLRGNENRLRDSPTMQSLTRTLHVLSLGLWFGSSVFFSFVVGLSLFSTFQPLGQDVAHRPKWLPLAKEFEKRDLEDPRLDGPKEQGTRVAGAAVTPMFPWYFLMQGLCGLIAVGTAVGLSRGRPERIHRLRVTLLLLAVATVIIGWPLEHKVSELRGPRYAAMDEYLKSDTSDIAARKNAALDAIREFGTWHTISLFLNFATIALVTVAMMLAARLPENRPVLPDKKSDEKRERGASAP
jgi:acyl-phosphate glycerol 3-phosphate acyltransferase